VSVGGVAFTVIAGLLLVVLPRRLAVIPLLLAAAYTTRLPIVELGPASLSALRILVVVGIARVLLRGERIANGVSAIDVLLFAWALLLVGSSAFHTPDAWMFRSGMVLGEVGVYVLCRIFIQDADDVRRLFAVLCVALLPLAMLMLLEKYTAHNFFSIMGGAGEINIREGHVRAYGPFAHAILAGTVGATCLAMAVAVWRTHRASALLGLAAGASIVFASTSSGPVMMAAFTGFALLLWKLRSLLGLVRWATLAGIVALDLVMNDPVYFLMARIDLAGGSAGWHRAQLIRSSIAHLGEWWAVGTDYTRHWMPTGVHANAIHTDITNHFLAMGVLGGLPLLILFVLMLGVAFRAVGRGVREHARRSPQQAFLIWTLGAMLFGQMMNFWAISLFDQSVSFFYLIIAAISVIKQPATVAAKARQLARGRRRRRTPRAVYVPAPVGLNDEGRGSYDSSIGQRRGSASAEPPLVSWPAEWRT
jgi:hypothetical protein